MSEYRHIANLRGERGPRALTEPITLSGSADIDSLEPDLYHVNFPTAARDMGLPVSRVGTLEVIKITTTVRLQRYTTDLGIGGSLDPSVDLQVWVRGMNEDREYKEWEQIYPTPYREPDLIDRSTSVFDLDPGVYRINFPNVARDIGLPRNAVGVVEVIRATTTMNMIRFTRQLGDSGPSSPVNPYEVWVCGMDVDRNYYPTWERVASGGTWVHAARAVVTDGHREAVFSRLPGSTDRPASTLKIMTAHVARTVVTDAMLEETVEFTEDDNVGGSSANLQVGDVITWRDLFYGLMLPSGNDAANLIAREAGELLSGSGDPYDRFIDEMNAMAQSYGWDGANFVNPSGLGSENQMSPNHLVDLLYRIAGDDAWLVEVMGSYRHEITIYGDNARTYHVTHSFDPLGEVAFPEAIAAKTGTLGGHTCLALLFEGPNGETCAAAVIGSTSSERYPDMRRLVDAARRAIDPDAATGGMVVPETILNERIDGITGGTVRISRSAGGTVSLTIQEAGMPDGFAQTQCIPAGLRPSNSFIYETVTVGNQSNPVSRGAQVNASNGQLRIYGEIDGSVRGSMTWATA